MHLNKLFPLSRAIPPLFFLQLMERCVSQSGVFACLINLSQFHIISSAGAVSSTVVGHVKTGSGGGGSSSGNTWSAVGFLLAIAGIVA